MRASIGESMVTEKQRLELLSILSLTTVLDIDVIVAKVNELPGMNVTAAEINDAINKLKAVKGS